MLVIHANWKAGQLHLWAESLQAFSALPSSNIVIHQGELNGQAITVASEQATAHPYAIDSSTLLQALSNVDLQLTRCEESKVILKLPHDLLGPWPSDRLVSVMGDYEQTTEPLLSEFEVPSIAVHPAQATKIVNYLSRHARGEKFEVGQSVHFWSSASQLAIDLLIDQRFVPTMLQVDRKHLTAKCTPWLHLSLIHI